MSVNLDQIINSNTFGVWKNRTNEIITALGDVATLGGQSGDNKNADLWINGDVTITGNTIVDVIKPYNTVPGANKVLIDSEAEINGEATIKGELGVTNGGSGEATLQFYNNTVESWRIATVNDHAELNISSPDGLTVLRITDTELTSDSLKIASDLFPNVLEVTLKGSVQNENGTIILDPGSNTEGDEALLTGQVSSIGNHTTDVLTEGTTNRYFSNELARGAISGGNGINVAASTGVISASGTGSITVTVDGIDIDDITDLVADTYGDSSNIPSITVNTKGQITAISTNAITIPPGIPTGSLIMYGSASAPSGWLSCDGAAVSRSTYSNLFDVIGTTYGPGDGETTFNVPDLRGRAPIGNGSGSDLTARSVGDEIGAETHTLTIEEIPSHTHSVPNSGSQNNSFDSGTLVGNDAEGTSGSTGGGLAHNNMQPSLAVGFIIKT